MTENNNQQHDRTDEKQVGDKPAETPSPGKDIRSEGAGSAADTLTDKQKKKHKGDVATKASGKNKPPIKNADRPQRSTSGGWWLAALALLIAMCSAAGAAWLWQQGMSEKQTLQQQLEQLGLIQTQITQLQQQATTNGQYLQTQWQMFQQQQSQELLSIKKQLAQSRDPSWVLAEAEYLVRIANHRLQLADDVDTAISALALADQRLQILRDPRLLPVRRTLSDDINRLKTWPRIDITGMALTLASLQQQMEELPLMGRITSGEPEDHQASTDMTSEKKSWRQFMNDIWVSLKGLVSIRRVSEQSTAIVPPEQRGYLYQNLALKLEVARYALLLNNETLYHQSLTMARNWLQRYFDNQDTRVQSVLMTLQQLDAVTLGRDMPEISASLQVLQDISLSRKPPQQITESKAEVAPTPAEKDMQDPVASDIPAGNTR